MLRSPQIRCKAKRLHCAVGSLVAVTLAIGFETKQSVQAQSPSPTTFAPITPQPNQGEVPNPGAAGADNFSAQEKQLTSTFTDYRTGQLYGRYIIYESVPVVKYQQKEVKEKQWVPEWVNEPKQITQTTYVPVVTYQLQLQTERTLNPFVVPRQYWQYVPIVQYQANHTPVMQQVTYQKYVEREFTKVVPELITTTEKVPRFADLPLANQPNAVAAGSSAQPTIATNPSTQPITPIPQVAMAAPPAYYIPPGYSASTAPSGTIAGTPNAAVTPVVPQALANAPAYNPNYGGWNANNPMLAARQYQPVQNQTAWNTNGRFLNNPQANAGLPSQFASNPYGTNPYGAGIYPANQYVAAMPQSAPFQWPQFMTRTGSLFQGGILRNNSTTNYSYPGAPYTGTSYVASNPLANSAIYPTGTLSSSSNGASFVPMTSPAQGAYYGAGNWNVAPVNNFRDPTQTGIPASVLR